MLGRKVDKPIAPSQPRTSHLVTKLEMNGRSLLKAKGVLSQLRVGHSLLSSGLKSSSRSRFRKQPASNGVQQLQEQVFD